MHAQMEYLSFFDDEEGLNIYNKLVLMMIGENNQRIIININGLRTKCPLRTKELLNSFCEEENSLKCALLNFVTRINPNYGKKHDQFYVGFEGSFGSHHVTSFRTINSKFANKLVCLEGIVIKCSLIDTKIVKSVYFCPVTKKTKEYCHTDTVTSPSGFKSSSMYPTKDDDGNPLETEYGLSLYKN